MRPIYLKMTAFGSYRGAAEVDFTRLYDNGLFLITGKTGGGKTTILDAICAALYGKATGSERAKDWKQMRCNHAPADTDTSLEFIFSVEGTEYRFFRRWHLPVSRKKDEPPVLKDAESACYRRAEGTQDWQLITSGSGKAVTEAAESILRLTQTQFVKVIMLPQGEFRELLTASSDEKEAIFQKLFDTERWERITERVNEEFRRVEKECEEHAARRALAFRSAECEDSAQLQTKIETGKTFLASLAQRAEENKVKTDAAAAALKAGEETAALFEELTARQKEAETLSHEEEAMRAVDETLRNSRRLRNVRPPFRLWQSAVTAADTAAKALTEAENGCKTAEESFHHAEENAGKLPAIEQRKTTLQSEAATLSELAQSRVPYDEALRKIKEDTSVLDAARTSLETLQIAKTDTEQRIGKGEEYLKECHTAAQTLAAATEALHTAEQQYLLTKEYEDNQKKLTALTDTLAEQEQEIARLTQELTSRRAVAAAVEQAIMNDKAYSLSVGLTEGAPCPVCGSVHHPRPAQPSENVPSSEELTRCRADAEQCADALENARKQYAAGQTEQRLLTETAEQLLQKAGGTFRKAAVEYLREKEAAATRVKTLKTLADNTDKAQKKLDKLRQELLGIQHDIEKTQTDSNNAGLRMAASRQTVSSIDERLRARSLDSFTALDVKLRECQKAIAALDAESKALTEALSAADSRRSAAQATREAAREHHTKAVNERAAREAEFREKCVEYGIAPDTDVAAGVLSEDDEHERERSLADFRERRAAVRKRIDELTAQVTGKEIPALEALRAASAAAAEEGQEIARQTGNATARLQLLKDTAATVADEEAALAALQPRYDTAARMQRFLSGRNDRCVPIHQYVIGIKMDEVILSANLYLSRLTRGQYAMKRKETKSGRARHQGLDIEIIDSAAGRERPVSTLSGGELFLASLSLAFGLSDVVQSFAGGIHLDSLFIDEGFGSLDSETLDTAMDAITQVRENKLLGIISHVTELQERIPCGIEVIKTAEGSALRMRG